MLENIAIQVEKYFTSHAYLVISATAFIVAAVLFAYFVGLLIRLALRNRVEDYIVDLTVRVSRITIIILSVISILSEFNINITSLIAGLGIFGFALAIGLRPVTTNFFTGLVLNTMKPFDEGDLIEAGRVKGRVESSNWFHTVVVGDDGSYVSVPNGPLWAGAIKNQSRLRPRRLNLDISFRGEVNREKVAAVIKKIIHDDRLRYVNFDPIIVIKESDESRTVFQTAVWYEQSQYWEARERLPGTFEAQLVPLGATDIEVEVLPRRRQRPTKSKPSAKNVPRK